MSVFLTSEAVLEIHDAQVAKFGGMPGVRSPELLDSAVAMPQGSMFGDLLHPDLPSQAAAYLFHLVQNHPFIDGNKRTALAATLAFLRLNGMMTVPRQEAFELTLGVATGKISKAEVTERIRGYQTADSAGPPDTTFDEGEFWRAVDLTASQVGDADALPMVQRFGMYMMRLMAEHGAAWIQAKQRNAHVQIVGDAGKVVFNGLQFVPLDPEDREDIWAAFEVPQARRDELRSVSLEKMWGSLALGFREGMIRAGLRELYLADTQSYFGWTDGHGNLSSPFEVVGVGFGRMDAATHRYYLAAASLTRFTGN